MKFQICVHDTYAYWLHRIKLKLSDKTALKNAFTSPALLSRSRAQRRDYVESVIQN